MSVKIKTTLIIVITLVIGMVLGVLGGGAMMHRRPRDFQGDKFGERFEQVMDRWIEPDAAQRDTIHEVIGRYAARQQALFEKHGAQMKALMDSMHTELMPLLTEEQQKRLKEQAERLRRFPDDGSPHRPPPPPRQDPSSVGF